jgi:hypothetical protein
MLRKKVWQKKSYMVMDKKNILHRITIPEKKFPASSKSPPPPSKVKWSAPKLLSFQCNLSTSSISELSVRYRGRSPVVNHLT